ncbi:MAG: hypothetical protein MPJ06_02185 [Nitrosopumilus sp.]|nr:hypothetical protein [Nitrosopumilus sp.]
MYDLPEIIGADTNACCHAMICFELPDGTSVHNDVHSFSAREFIMGNVEIIRVTEIVAKEFKGLVAKRNKSNLLKQACKKIGMPELERPLRDDNQARWDSLTDKSNWLEFDECMGCLADPKKYILNDEYKAELKHVRDCFWIMYREVFYSDKKLYHWWSGGKLLKPGRKPPDTPDGYARDPEWPPEYPPSNNDLNILATVAIFARRCNLRVGFFTFDKDAKLIFDAVRKGLFDNHEGGDLIRNIELIWGEDLSRWLP